jgi:hypothetical protein
MIGGSGLNTNALLIKYNYFQMVTIYTCAANQQYHKISRKIKVNINRFRNTGIHN